MKENFYYYQNFCCLKDGYLDLVLNPVLIDLNLVDQLDYMHLLAMV